MFICSVRRSLCSGLFPLLIKFLPKYYTAACPAFGPEPDLRYSVGLLPLRRCELSVPDVAAGRSASGILLLGSNTTTRVIVLLQIAVGLGAFYVAYLWDADSSPHISRSRDGRRRHHFCDVGVHLRLYDGELLCPDRRLPVRAAARNRAPRGHAEEADGGQGRSRTGQRRQVRIPGQDEPRAAHAAQRRHRLQRDPARRCRTRRPRRADLATCRRSAPPASICCRWSTTSSTYPRSRPARWTCSSRISTSTSSSTRWRSTAGRWPPRTPTHSSSIVAPMPVGHGASRCHKAAAGRPQPRSAMPQSSRTTARSRCGCVATAPASGDWIEIAVVDTGVGISQEQQKASVLQVHAGQRQDRIQVWRHGAWIVAQPQPMPVDGRRYHGRERAGQGLLLHHPPAGQSPQDAEHADMRSIADDETGASDAHGEHAPNGSSGYRRTSSQRPGRKRRILIVDDDRAFLELAERLLIRKASASICHRQRPRSSCNLPARPGPMSCCSTS